MSLQVFFAILVSTLVSVWGDILSHNTLASRPIFMGFVAGLMLGDPAKGTIIGAQMELAFLGVTHAGGAQTADIVVSTIMTTIFCIEGTLDMEVAIPLGTTIGYAGSVLSSTPILISEFANTIAKKLLAEDNRKKYQAFTYFGSMIYWTTFRTLVCIAGIMIGGPALEAFVNALPPFVLTGIGAAGAMLPALGLSIILSFVLSKDVIIYFMVGFVIFKYLNVDMVFMLFIGLLLAILNFNINTSKTPAVSEAKSEEEEFLS